MGAQSDTPRKHALLSASGAHRWIHCPPSARLEETIEEVTSVYAEEGTAAHALGEYKLRLLLGTGGEKYVGKGTCISASRPTCEWDGQEMEQYTDDYVAYACELIADARQRCRDPIILVEQRVDFSGYVQDGFGTTDLLVIADGVLDVCDLKYGKGVEVSAEENPQMMLYALGALALFDSLYDIQTVRMSICQPRIGNISQYPLSVKDLTDWAAWILKPAAKLAYAGEGEFQPGEHCRFCRARHTCRARAETYLAMAQYDFKSPALLTGEEMAAVLSQADALTAWCKDVWAWAESEAMNGRCFEGYKLVEGRSNRIYVDEQQVAEKLIGAGYAEDVIYIRALKGITALEKTLGRKAFHTLLQGPLNGLVVKPEGRPLLAPVSDKRPEIGICNNAVQSNHESGTTAGSNTNLRTTAEADFTKLEE